MYLADLSQYNRFQRERSLNVVSIGWLEKPYLYSRGETSEEFRERLFEFCLNSVFRMRGFHVCQFCVPPPKFLVEAQLNGREVKLGSAEIRVIHQNKVFAAPNMIYHYVVNHSYKPPDVFVEAVLNGPAPDSAEYSAFKNKYLMP